MIPCQLDNDAMLVVAPPLNMNMSKNSHRTGASRASALNHVTLLIFAVLAPRPSAIITGKFLASPIWGWTVNDKGKLRIKRLLEAATTTMHICTTHAGIY